MPFPKRLAILAAIALTCSPIKLDAQPEVGLAERIRGAERVVVGVVLQVDPILQTNEFGDELIVSRTAVQIKETLRGRDDANVIEVDIEGGTFGELTLSVSDVEPVEPGERAVFLLNQGAAGAFVPHLQELGILRLDARGRGQLDARGRGREQPWSLDEIRAVVLTTYSAPQQAYSLCCKWRGVSAQYWVNHNNLDGLSKRNVIRAVKKGAKKWNSVKGSYFNLVYRGTTNRSKVSRNGYNDVFFRNNRKRSAIATNYIWSIRSTIVESDTVLWDKANRFFTGRRGCRNGFYVEDVITHELGHFVGIRHSNVANATMYSRTRYCNKAIRTLARDDKRAIKALY